MYEIYKSIDLVRDIMVETFTSRLKVPNLADIFVENRPLRMLEL